MGPFQLYVEVVDDDGVFGNELIDEVKVQVPGTKGAAVSSLASYPGPSHASN